MLSGLVSFDVHIALSFPGTWAPAAEASEKVLCAVGPSPPAERQVSHRTDVKLPLARPPSPADGETGRLNYSAPSEWSATPSVGNEVLLPLPPSVLSFLTAAPSSVSAMPVTRKTAGSSQSQAQTS